MVRTPIILTTQDNILPKCDLQYKSPNPTKNLIDVITCCNSDYTEPKNIPKIMKILKICSICFINNRSSSVVSSFKDSHCKS